MNGCILAIFVGDGNGPFHHDFSCDRHMKGIRGSYPPGKIN